MGFERLLIGEIHDQAETGLRKFGSYLLSRGFCSSCCGLVELPQPTNHCNKRDVGIVHGPLVKWEMWSAKPKTSRDEWAPISNR